MSTSSAVLSPSANVKRQVFWERNWRSSGINFVVLLIVSCFIYGNQPPVGASVDALGAFYGAHRTRILIGAFCFAFNLLNLLWFAAALRTTLADAGQDGWGTALTTASALFGGMFLILVGVSAVLAYSIAGSGNQILTSALNDLAWTLFVLTSFPRAMLIMAGSFGLWRAGAISNALFAVGVTALVLVLLGGSTWMTDGFWAVDGLYSRYVSPIVGLAWVLMVSRVLTKRPATRTGW